MTTENSQSAQQEGDQSKAKKNPTKRDVTALLKEFTPQEADKKSPAELERTRRLMEMQFSMKALVEDFTALEGHEGDTAHVVAGLKALQTASKKFAAAIASLSDSKLLGQEPEPKKRTQPNPLPKRPEVQGNLNDEAKPPRAQGGYVPDSQDGQDGQDSQDDTVAKAAPEGGVDAFMAQQAQARSGPGTKPASPTAAPENADSSNDPRGDVDPNEGF